MSHAFVGQVRQRCWPARGSGGRVSPGGRDRHANLRSSSRTATTSITSPATARCSRASRARTGSGLTAGEAQSQGALAVQALRRAVAAGLHDFAFMRRDTDLDPLRLRTDFQLLMMDLAFPDDPFARETPRDAPDRRQPSKDVDVVTKQHAGIRSPTKQATYIVHFA